LLVVATVGLLGYVNDAPPVFRTDRPILRLKLDEYRISPQTIDIGRGRTKFVVRNTGRLTHNLVIEKAPTDSRDEPEVFYQTTTLQPGQSAAPFKLVLPPGKYRLRCTIANHDDLGQYGELRVRARTESLGAGS
jgi:uncharacterized cupredoxin-like copper-binding protein